MIIKPETCTAGLIALAITAFLVMGLLLLISLGSWTTIFRKIFQLRSARAAAPSSAA